MIKDNLILAIESTGSNCGVAIGSLDTTYLNISLNVKHSHDKKLATIIKTSLDYLDISIADISAVAISSGPGSFTGLRVGSALAKGLTFDDSPKLITVPTLSSVAYYAKDYLEAVSKSSITVLIPSNRDYYFIQNFDENAQKTSEPEILSKEEIIKLYDNNSLYCGPGSIDFEDSICELFELDILTPKNILKFARNEFSNGRFIKSEEFSPRYYQEFKPTQKKSK
ncbi:MAG: tRNA (adenosine(37)-N6)-threonylcarbamoyltransferase complex dimerization subunit type 1 TsaB [Chlorobiota bacterium]